MATPNVMLSRTAHAIGTAVLATRREPHEFGDTRGLGRVDGLRDMPDALELLAEFAAKISPAEVERFNFSPNHWFVLMKVDDPDERERTCLAVQAQQLLPGQVEVLLAGRAA